MTTIRVSIAACISILIGSHTIVFAQPEKAWKSIFDGKSLKGWTIVDSPANVIIADSSFVIHMTANTNRHVFIRSNERYKDFILELDCKRDTAFDSGILFRGIKSADTAKVGLYGYMVKIDPSTTRLWTGGVFLDFGGTWIEWLHPLADNPRAQKAERVGQWNRFRIEAIGNHIKVSINGIPTTNMTNSRYVEGYIALKIHYLKNPAWNEQMSASFKNIRIINSKAAAYAREMDIPVKDVK
ncbi:MAG: DUF1080 domain-containing protein [Chitinophagaceae bacterium]